MGQFADGSRDPFHSLHIDLHLAARIHNAGLDALILVPGNQVERQEEVLER